MRRYSTLWAALLTAAVFFALYALTAQRGISWQDSGEYQFRIETFDLVWNSGIARAHPGYIIGGALWAAAVKFVFPLTEVYTVTLYSALGMSIALFFLFLCVVKLTGRRLSAFAATVTLGLAHMAWWMSTMAEVYTWSLAFTLAAFYIFMRITDGRHALSKDINLWCALFLILGLHFSYHNFALLEIPVYVALYFVVNRDNPLPRRAAGLFAASFVVGSLPIWVLAAGELLHGDRVCAVVQSILFGHGYSSLVLGTAKVAKLRVACNFALAGLSLTTPVFAFVFSAFRTIRREKWLKALLMLSVIHFLFWVRYFVPDQATFALPTLGLLAVWAGVGVSKLRNSLLWTVIFVGIALQTAAPFIASGIVHKNKFFTNALNSHRTLPFRDDAYYWLKPWKFRENSAERFREELQNFPKTDGFCLFADSTVYPIAAIVQRNDCRAGKNWHLYSPWDDERNLSVAPEARDRTLFIVSPKSGYVPESWLDGRFNFEKNGVLWYIVPVSDLHKRTNVFL